jgi:hypothetical protein
MNGRSKDRKPWRFVTDFAGLLRRKIVICGVYRANHLIGIVVRPVQP